MTSVSPPSPLSSTDRKFYALYNREYELGVEYESETSASYLIGSHDAKEVESISSMNAQAIDSGAEPTAAMPAMTEYSKEKLNELNCD